MNKSVLPASDASRESLDRETDHGDARSIAKTILLVEDDEAVRSLMKTILERRGYRILDAADGVEALRLWGEHRASVHLLLTDVVLPEGLAGWELAEQLQRQNPALKVIFVTGYNAALVARECKLPEGKNVVQKPWAPHELLEIVRRCLDG
jgi:CheY-like chemotaxis protein